MAVAIGLDTVGLVSPCMKNEKTPAGETYGEVPVDECFRMDPPRRWKGLWRDEFEGSRFCPAPATRCDFNMPGDLIWLNPERVSRKEPDGGLYAVEFIGRRTAVKGRFYGHLGGSDYELIVDRFISMKQVEAPPPQPTKAQMIKDWKACEAEGTCRPNWDAINKIQD